MPQAQKIQVRCERCGKSYVVPQAAEGKRVRCRSCSTSFTVKPPKASPTSADAWLSGLAALDSDQPGASQGEACPRCGNSVGHGAVVCINCGANLQSGRKNRTRVYKAPKEKTRRVATPTGESRGMVGYVRIIAGVLLTIGGCYFLTSAGSMDGVNESILGLLWIIGGFVSLAGIMIAVRGATRGMPDNAVAVRLANIGMGMLLVPAGLVIGLFWLISLPAKLASIFLIPVLLVELLIFLSAIIGGGRLFMKGLRGG